MNVPAGVAEIRVGDLIAGRYMVDALLNVGRTAVATAVDRLVERRVTLQIFFQGRSASEAIERWFRQWALETEQNEQFVRVIDGGTLDDGSVYVVSERIDGVDPARRRQSALSTH